MAKQIKVQAEGIGSVYLNPDQIEIELYKEGDTLDIYTEDVVDFEGNGHHLVNSAADIIDIDDRGDLVIVTIDIGDGPHWVDE